MFTTNDPSHSTTGVYNIGLRDHYMIFTVYSNVHDRDGHHEKVLTFRNYKTFSTERFLTDLLSLECIHDTDWCSSLLESIWYEFKNAFIKLSNEHAPIQCRRLKNKSNPWFDADILAMIYRRDYLKRKAINVRTVDYGRTIDPKEMQLRVSYVKANVIIMMKNKRKPIKPQTIMESLKSINW